MRKQSATYVGCEISKCDVQTEDKSRKTAGGYEQQSAAPANYVANPSDCVFASQNRTDA